MKLTLPRTFAALTLAGLLPLAPARAAAPNADPSPRHPDLRIASPDELNEIRFNVIDGKPVYAVSRRGRTVLHHSRMGFELAKGPSLASGLTRLGSSTVEHDETWEQPWGEKRFIRDHYRGARVTLARAGAQSAALEIEFRAYNDGIAFRYVIPGSTNREPLTLLDERTEFALREGLKAWWIPAYEPNRYEYLYTASPVEALEKKINTPATFESGDGLFLSIHEAALTDFAAMALVRTGDRTLKADLFPWSDGTKVKALAPIVSPWRTLQLSDTAGSLITSYLILNLNEPNKLGDVSWVKPGKYAGVWWEMHLGTKTWASGDRHGATTENTRKHIDFAAANGLSGVLVEGWNMGWDGDWVANGNRFSFTQPYPDFDLQALAEHAAKRNVTLIGHHETACGITNYEAQMEAAFELCQILGIRAVKTGYVCDDPKVQGWNERGEPTLEWHHGQFMVRHYRRALESAARHRIMLCAHEPIKATGIRRTYPNMMSREGARGQEYNAWSGANRNPPEHETILPFTRLLAGPMDFTPGIFRLKIEDLRPGNRVPTTLAKQLALYVVLYSPLQMVPDLPEHYAARPDAFQFIKDVPTDWADTLVLNARIGDYVTLARKDRHSDDWFLGSVADEHAHDLEARLSFLDPDRDYIAEIYRDGKGAAYDGDPYPIDVVRKRVNHRSGLSLHLAPGGGQAIRIRPAAAADAPIQ